MHTHCPRFPVRTAPHTHYHKGVSPRVKTLAIEALSVLLVVFLLATMSLPRKHTTMPGSPGATAQETVLQGR